MTDRRDRLGLGVTVERSLDVTEIAVGITEIELTVDRSRIEGDRPLEPVDREG